MVLHRHWFCNLNSGTKKLFISTLLLSLRLQIWELYSIVGLTTAVYSRRVNQNKSPHVEVTIYNAAKNVAALLWVTCVMCLFQFSLKSTQTPKILRVTSGFASYLWIFTVEAKSLFALFFLMK